VTYMPFEEYGAEMRSQHTFVDFKAAQKDAKKLHYFRAKLVTNCQTEFQQSTMNVRLFCYSTYFIELESLVDVWRRCRFPSLSIL